MESTVGSIVESTVGNIVASNVLKSSSLQPYLQ